MTTQQAFEELINNPELTKRLDAELGTIRQWRKRFNEGKLPLEKQEELLKKVGAKKIPEHWKFKKK